MMMKKVLMLCMVAVLLAVLTACGTPSGNPEMTEAKGSLSDLPLAQVHVVISEDYCRSIADLGIDVPKSVIRSGLAPESFERPVGEQMTWQSDKRSFELSYESTYTYMFEGGAVDYYHIDGTEKGRIGFYKDGALSRLNNYPYIQIDLDDDVSPERVQELVAEEIDDLVDFSNYSQISCYQRTTGEYVFTLLNMYNGHLVDYARVRVGSNGGVEHISIIYGPEDGERILGEVDEKLVEELIQAKVESLLNTKTTELRSYHISDETTDGTEFGRSLTTYEDEVCLRYSVRGDVYVAAEDRECAVSVDVVIPVRLVTKD